MLIDSCSTHNFLSASLSAKLKLPISAKNYLTVMVGNGDLIFSQGFCARLIVTMQKWPVSTDFYLLNFPDYDVVLGAHWL